MSEPYLDMDRYADVDPDAVVSAAGLSALRAELSDHTSATLDGDTWAATLDATWIEADLPAGGEAYVAADDAGVPAVSFDTGPVTVDLETSPGGEVGDDLLVNDDTLLDHRGADEDHWSFGHDADQELGDVD